MASQETKDAIFQKDIEALAKDLNRLANDVDENDKKYYVIFVAQKDFDTMQEKVKRINAYGNWLVLLIGGIIIAAIMRLVVIK
jgi:ABC-type antimicrobial peptide transport system permease subunit